MRQSNVSFGGSKSRAASMMKMEVVRATASIDPEDANVQSLQLAAKELGGDELGLRDIIEKDPVRVTRMERKMLVDFLATRYVVTIPHYPRVGEWYDEGAFRVNIMPAAKRRDTHRRTIMGIIEDAALSRRDVQTVEYVTKNRTELEVGFQPERGSEWTPVMEFAVNNRGELYCLLNAKDIDDVDALITAKWLRGPALRKEIDRVARLGKMTTKMRLAMHNFVDSLRN